MVGYRTDAKRTFWQGQELTFVPWGTSVGVRENRQLSLETVRDMQVAVDVAWNSLTPEQQGLSSKTVLATRILDAAAAGERSPARLVRLALMSASGV